MNETFTCEVRNYGLLFNLEKPGDADDYLLHLNKNSEETLPNVKCHNDLLKDMKITDRYQFERQGFYCLDKETDIEKGKIIWNQTVGLNEAKLKK